MRGKTQEGSQTNEETGKDLTNTETNKRRLKKKKPAKSG